MAKKVKKSVKQKKFTPKVWIISAIVLVVVVAAIIVGLTVTGKPTAQLNDTVKVDYIGYLADGTVFDTSISEVAAVHDNLAGKTNLQPLEFVIGEGGLLPKFEDAVVGMNVGQTKTVELKAEDAYGPVQDNLIIQVPREQKIDRYITLNTSEFKQVFEADPELNKVYNVPGLDWKLKVVELKADSVKSENVVTESGTVQMPGASWKSTITKIDSTKIYLQQTPKIGDVLALPTGISVMRGVVTNVGEVNFTVDMNHPLAGKDLTFKITLVELVKK